MRSTATFGSSSADVAKRIRHYADSELSNADVVARLRDVASAVEGGVARPWAHIDLFQAFGPQAVLDDDFKVAQRGRSAELARNLLILCPIIVTWTGLAEAVRAYHEFIEANPDKATSTFLSLWQGGFDGRLLFLWKFTWLALVDALLIGAVVVLTLIAARREQLVVVSRQRLALLLGDAASALGDAPGHLTDASVRIREVSTEIAAMVKDVRDLVLEVSNGAGEARLATDRMRAVVEELGQTVGSESPLASLLLDQLNDRQELRSLMTDLDQSVSEIAQASQEMGSVAASVAAAATSVADASATNSVTSGNMSSAVVALRDAMDESHSHVVEMTNLALTLQKFGPRFTEYSDVLSRQIPDLLDAQRRAGNALATAAERVEQCVGGIMETAARVQDTMTDLSDRWRAYEAGAEPT